MAKKYMNVGRAIELLKNLLDNGDLEDVAEIIGHAFGAKLWVRFVGEHDQEIFEVEPVEGEYMEAFDEIWKDNEEDAI